MYSANGTRSLITSVTIDEFIAKSFKLNPDNTSYANLLMISLQQGSICQTKSKNFSNTIDDQVKANAIACWVPILTKY